MIFRFHAIGAHTNTTFRRYVTSSGCRRTIFREFSHFDLSLTPIDDAAGLMMMPAEDKRKGTAYITGHRRGFPDGNDELLLAIIHGQ